MSSAYSCHTQLNGSNPNNKIREYYYSKIIHKIKKQCPQFQKLRASKLSSMIKGSITPGLRKENLLKILTNFRHEIINKHLIFCCCWNGSEIKNACNTDETINNILFHFTTAIKSEFFHASLMKCVAIE